MALLWRSDNLQATPFRHHVPAASAPAAPLAAQIDAALARIAPRAKSLIVTVFGDSIAPHGGRLWMGSLIRLMAPLGVNERLVRTAVQRLTAEQWLRSVPVGRRSWYGLTDAGRQRIDAVYTRIYAMRPLPWDGAWRIALALHPALKDAERSALQREFGWLGFGGVAPGVYVHPGIADAVVQATVAELGLAGKVVQMTARCGDPADGPATPPCATWCWPARTCPASPRCTRSSWPSSPPCATPWNRGATLDGEQAFRLRSGLVHLFRRALLRDPQFPAAMLPADWPGIPAQALCRDLYRQVSAPAEDWLLAELEVPDHERAPEADAAFRQRFSAPLGD
ncbi:MAG: phenylacetic acid degradation operon negative regulatory protein PaaX [Burkholderiales bacterium]|nr:phenylacetic acid degradation operon negative regulatory protein PaaX [Burkholderiales bacterium]